jgi:predicted AAA+ superfamily ATPase
MLRFFQEERPDIHLVAAGSLLEVALEAQAISFPVGRVQYLHLRPFSFAEFLEALGETLAHEVLTKALVSGVAHDKLLRLFHTYTLVGGMPEAVRAYVRSGGNLPEVNLIYSDLFAAFRDDIARYGRNETMRRVLLHALDAAPYAAGARVTFHGFGGSNYRSREMGEALRTLERAMLLELVYPTVACDEPLAPDLRKSPRLHFLDVGLVNHRAGLQRELLGTRDLAERHRGRTIEQVVGQELKTAMVRENAPLVFWVREKPQAQAEVDFLLRTARGIVPVEAKSGSAGKLRSLHQFMARSRAPLAVRLYAGKPAQQRVAVAGAAYRLLSIPYYAAGRIGAYLDASEKPWPEVPNE